MCLVKKVLKPSIKEINPSRKGAPNVYKDCDDCVLCGHHPVGI